MHAWTFDLSLKKSGRPFVSRLTRPQSSVLLRLYAARSTVRGGSVGWDGWAKSKRVSQRCAVPHGVWKRLGTSQISHVKFKIALTSVILLRLRASFTSEICLIKIDITWIFPFKDLLRNGQRRHWAMMFFSSAALSSLRDLSKATSILSDPSKVPEQALRAAASRDPTDLAAMMAPAGANGGPGNTGAQGGGFS